MALIVIGTACKASFPLICNLVFDYILLLWLIFSQFFALKCSETLRRLTIGPVGACRKSLQWYWSLHLTQTRSTLSFTGQKSYSVFACSVTYPHTTGFIHKSEMLDICLCEFKQADRQRNIPKYGCSESHILPAACLHLMWGCADISSVIKCKSNTEIQRSDWKMNDKLF